MATNQQNNLFAPPQPEELSGEMFAAPSKQEMDSLFAPPSPQELGQPEEKPAPESLKDTDFQEIGKKYGVDPQELRSLAPYYGAKIGPESLGEAVEVGAKSAAGFAGRTVGLGIPQFVYKKLQNENTRKAIDELRSIARKQQTPMELASEIVTPGGAIGTAAKRSLPRILGAAGTGAVIGTSESEEGKELRGAATGAAIGTGLGVSAELLGKLVSKYKPSSTDEALFEAQSKQGQFNLEQGIDDINKKTAKSENLLEDLGFGRKETLSSQDVNDIVEEQVGREALAKYLNPSSEEGLILRDRISARTNGEVTEQAVKRQLVDDLVEKRARDFAEDLVGKRPPNFETAMNEIEEIASRQGSEAVLNRYKDFVKLQQAEKYIEEQGLRAIEQPGFFGRAANFVSDNQYVLRGIDEKYGSKTEDILRDLNKDFNRSTFALTKFRHDYDSIFQNARKLGTDDTVVSTDRIYNALDTGALKGLSKEEQQTAQGFRDYFNEIRDFVNAKVKDKDARIAPLNIPFRENYVPKMVKSTPEMVAILEKKLAEATAELEGRLGRKINDLAQLRGDEFKIASQSESVNDLIKAVELFDNRAVKDGADLSSRLKEMLYSREGNIGLESQARAALERKGGIPDFLLEKNLYKLARRYTDNTIKHLYLRNNIDKLRYQSQALRKAGADVESKYVANIVRDVLGVRQGTAAEAMMQAKIKAARTLDRMIDRVGKDSYQGGVLTAIKAMPDMMQSLTRQIYPNVLGYFNIRAILQNATQGLTKSAPELGTKYGYATLLRGAVNTVGNFRRLTEKARTLGTIPEEFIRKGEAAIAEGIQRSSLYQIPAKAIEGMAHAGMILFRKSEEFNRALALGMGEVMARDLARGSRIATEALSKLPRNIRNEILANRNNPEMTANLIGKYLNDATQYNYNRASMSEFGRVMGPFFSTFSKWPTATVGDMLQEIRNKGLTGGALRNAEKYVAPFMLLQTIDYLAGERLGDSESLSDRQKKFMGSAGLSQSAPIGAIGAIAKGEIFTPPIVDAVVQGIINPVLEGDAAKFEKGAGAAAGNFTPFAGLFRLITDDLVTYITGERPEGNNPIERSIEGARRIVK